ncbi:MAG: RNA polymerase sigma factor, partial [Defluviitaleaceae bacterium]|nr:RNA polymerase sigma factor [Defluviitaleaceae bacterium]
DTVMDVEKMPETLERPETVIDLYKDALYRIAYTYCRNASDAEDVVQEVFVRYIRRKSDFVNEDHRKAWLITVTVNISKNIVRSAWRRKTVPMPENAAGTEAETGKTVRNAVMALPEKYRVAVALYYFEDYPVKEIAKILRRTETAVQTQLQRARAMLKKILEEDWDDDGS